MKHTFRGLYVWTASVDLAADVIALSAELAARKQFALADQLRRAAISVPSNIAEGHGRITRRDFRHFLSQARGSLYELETQIEIVMRAGLAPDASNLRAPIAKIGCGLTRLIESIKV